MKPLVTKTGQYPIGFRKFKHGEWHKETKNAVKFATENYFSAFDLLREGAGEAKMVRGAGLKIGSVDLLEWQGMISPDAAKRKESVQKNIDYISGFSKEDRLNFFLAMLPEKPDLPRDENFRYMIESFRALTPVLEAQNAKIVIEGFPGPGALCCTPESYRGFFKECSSPVFGINYDPSHLIRMGIDPLRFLREFVGRVYHVHAKDTLLLEEGLYEYGNFQPATFSKKVKFCGWHYRYTIPSHGLTDWPAVFGILKKAGYQGCVSIELEDINFSETTELQNEGLLKAAQFLSGC